MNEEAAKQLGTFSLLALGINGVVGVGIFFVPAPVARLVPGTTGALVYLAVGVLCLPVAMVFARLGPRFPRDGGPYLYARDAFGPRTGFFVGWLTYVSAVLSAASVIRGLAGALSSSWNTPWVTTSVLATFLVLVLWGMVVAGLRFSSWAWNALTVAKVLPLTLLLVVGLWVVAPASANAVVFEGKVDEHVSLMSMARAGLVVLFALQGFEIVAVPAGHVKELKQVAWVTPLVPSVAAILYAGLHYVAVRSVPALGTSQAPLVDAAMSVGGVGISKVVWVTTSVSAGGIALGMMAMTPRYLSTLGSEEGLGEWLGRESSRAVPTRALAVTGVLVLVLVQLQDLPQLFALSSIAVLGQYGASALALSFLGWKRRRGLRRSDVWVGGAGGLASAVVVLGASWGEVWRAAVVVAAGGVWLWWAHRRATTSSPNPKC